MALLAPYVNSYRRIVRHTAAPINLQWGQDNRTVGIRVLHSDAQSRRLENRVVGADANLMSLWVTLACGYLGMVEQIEPGPEQKGSAYNDDYQLPRSLSEALRDLHETPALHNVLGENFIAVYSAVKELEYEEFMKVISPWEREHLLLHV
jgi:glutamine synthetase